MNAQELRKLVLTINFMSSKEMNQLANALFNDDESQASRFRNCLTWAEMESGTKNVYADSGVKV